MHTHHIHNASGGRPNKSKTQTRIIPKTVAHAPHSLQAAYQLTATIKANASIKAATGDFKRSQRAKQITKTAQN